MPEELKKAETEKTNETKSSSEVSNLKDQPPRVPAKKVPQQKKVPATNKPTTEKEAQKETVAKENPKKTPRKRMIHRHVLFFIVCFVSTFIIVWTWANGWQNFKAGENESWFHEFLGSFLLIGMCILSYFKIYRQSRVYLLVVEQKESEEKAAADLKEKLEKEKKEKTFRNIISDFHAAETFEATSISMTKLLTVGIESEKMRQEVVSIIGKLNDWMYENKVFLTVQQLMAWRIKKALFEKSDRFQIDAGTQDLSIKAINIIEAIIKRHILDFKGGKVDFALDLSNIAIPTLTLTSQYIPAGSLYFENAILWQSSFSEAIMQGTSFLGSDLQKASFWRAKIENVDFQNANFKNAKLRTDLQKARNLTAEQFLSTREWELCFISHQQMGRFFPEQYDTSPDWERWEAAKSRRDKLYFNFEQL